MNINWQKNGNDYTASIMDGIATAYIISCRNNGLKAFKIKLQFNDNVHIFSDYYYSLDKAKDNVEYLIIERLILLTKRFNTEIKEFYKKKSLIIREKKIIVF